VAKAGLASARALPINVQRDESDGCGCGLCAAWQVPLRAHSTHIELTTRACSVSPWPRLLLISSSWRPLTRHRASRRRACLSACGAHDASGFVGSCRGRAVGHGADCTRGRMPNRQAWHRRAPRLPANVISRGAVAEGADASCDVATELMHHGPKHGRRTRCHRRRCQQVIGHAPSP